MGQAEGKPFGQHDLVAPILLRSPLQAENNTQASHEAERCIWIIPLKSETLLRNLLGLEVHHMITFSVLFGLTPQDLYSSLRVEVAREQGTGLPSQSVNYPHQWLLPLPDHSSPSPGTLTLLGVKGLSAWGWAED